MAAYPSTTDNCDVMNVVVTNAGDNPNRCLVVMDHYENHHVEKWQRNGEKGPLQVVHRSTNPVHGRVTDDYNVKHPGKVANSIMFKDSTVYLPNMKSNLKTLDAIIRPIALDNTVIVMVCNKGQVDMLLNFQCSAKARNLQNLQQVVIFATDAEVDGIARSLGFTTYLL